jgi:hypothetical protein
LPDTVNRQRAGCVSVRHGSGRPAQNRPSASIGPECG